MADRRWVGDGTEGGLRTDEGGSEGGSSGRGEDAGQAWSGHGVGTESHLMRINDDNGEAGPKSN